MLHFVIVLSQHIKLIGNLLIWFSNMVHRNKRPTVWMTVGQGLTALAIGAGGVAWTFLLSSILSLLFLPLFGRRSDIG